MLNKYNTGLNMILKEHLVQEVKSQAIVTIIALTIGFLLTSGLVWLACLAFSIAFTWKLAFGVGIIILILKQGETRC